MNFSIKAHINLCLKCRNCEFCPSYDCTYDLLGALSIIGWSTFWSVVMFGALKVTNLLRVTESAEETGLDVEHHGEITATAAVARSSTTQAGDHNSDNINQNIKPELVKERSSISFSNPVTVKD